MKWWFSIAFLFTQLIFLLLIITQNERLQNVAMTLVLKEPAIFQKQTSQPDGQMWDITADLATPIDLPYKAG
jgi:hypothetical protein